MVKFTNSCEYRLSGKNFEIANSLYFQENDEEKAKKIFDYMKRDLNVHFARFQTEHGLNDLQLK